MECSHCGDTCSSLIKHKDQVFCCQGCKTVYQLLLDHQLGNYYSIEQNPGIKTAQNSTSYEFLDDEEFQKKHLLYEDSKICKVHFSIPKIHCSSCIWLLENLSKFNLSITSSTVHFSKRTVGIVFEKSAFSIRQLVELLHSIGYTPDLQTKHPKQNQSVNKTIFYKIGIAGFCFGNVMLLSFPEYLGIDNSFQKFSKFFAYLSFVLTLPSLFYSGTEFLTNAWKGLKQKYINMDVPIALGILTLFIRSTYEVFSNSGTGYFDSLTGLIFFLLIGKWFQRKTYDSLAFDRDYKSYFPIAVNKIQSNQLISTPIEQLNPNDSVQLINQELIPADGILLSASALIDYSFVTGESESIRKENGETIYAGGRIVGDKIKYTLRKKVSTSYLTQLWNQDVFHKKTSTSILSEINNQVGKYFTWVILGISILTSIYWWAIDSTVLWNSLSAVLIVACPCALALSIPFTYGNMMRIFGKKGFYLKNASMIEKMASITAIVVDKTGTITHKNSKKIQFEGQSLNPKQQIAIKSLVDNSMHPISQIISNHMKDVDSLLVLNFKEVIGMGIEGIVDSNKIELGSAKFLSVNSPTKHSTYLKINGKLLGGFRIEQDYRKGLKKVIQFLTSKYNLSLLSGDQNHQSRFLSDLFPNNQLLFKQSPMDKLHYIQSLQSKGEKVLMLGDGLNDAGALKQSDVGISIADDIHQFTPACDAILQANQFHRFHHFLKLASKSILVVKFSFLLSFLYNLIGIYFAITGQLSPIIAAILMPLSSISVVLFTSISSSWISRDL